MEIIKITSVLRERVMEPATRIDVKEEMIKSLYGLNINNNSKKTNQPFNYIEEIATVQW